MLPPRNKTAEALSYWTLGVEFALRHALRASWHKMWLRDDMNQAALTGLWVAALKYDASRGVEFKTYAWFWVKRYLQEEKRCHHLLGHEAGSAELKGKPLPLVVSYQTMKKYDGSMEDTSLEFAAPPEGSWVDDRDYIRHLVDTLPEGRLQEAARGRWVDGLCDEEISKQMGINAHTVRYHCLRAFRLMKELADRGLVKCG